MAGLCLGAQIMFHEAVVLGEIIQKFQGVEVLWLFAA